MGVMLATAMGFTVAGAAQAQDASPGDKEKLSHRNAERLLRLPS